MAVSLPKCPSSRFLRAHFSERRCRLAGGPSPLRSLPRSFLPRGIASQSSKDRDLRVLCKREVTAETGSATKEVTFKNVENGGLPNPSSQEYGDAVGLSTDKHESTVSITVVGASGDLAKKKIFPALFALYYEGCLPKHFTIFGYARSKMTDAELRTMVSKTLTCRIDKRENCNDKMEQFLKRCFYHSGQYDLEEDFGELDKKLKEHEP